MVIGTEFAWGHVPKSGGDATARLFSLFPELVLDSDPPDSNAKHGLFRDREEAIAGKELVLNIRRLPSWNLSRALHEAVRGVYPDYTPRPMRSPHEISESQFADGWITCFTDDGRLEITTWLRMEHLAEDFLAFVSRHTSVSDQQRARALEIGRVNELGYDHEIGHWFSDDQVRRMYEHNPLWRDAERAAFREWPRLS